MTDKPKPLTKAEWHTVDAGGPGWCDSGTWHRVAATLDALFRYRERTRGWSAEYNTFSDTIAAEEGIE